MGSRCAESPVKNAKERLHATDASSNGVLDNTENHRMLVLGRLLKNPKSDNKELQQFRATIAADKDKLKALIVRRNERIQMKQKHHNKKLASKIREALSTPNRRSHGEMAAFAGTRIASNAIHATVTDVLSASKSLVGEYKRLDGIISKLRGEQTHSIAETWRQEIVETEEQLRLGARVALRKVTKILGAEMASGDATVVTDDAGDVRMDEGANMQLACELPQNPRYTEKGTKRMTKRVPMNEGR